MTVVGYLEHATGRVIAGWAADEARPDLPVVVEVFEAGRVVGRTLADLNRPDVGAATTFGSHHGFYFFHAAGLADGVLTVQVAGQPLERAESDEVVETILGAIERAEDGYVVGWALDSKYPDRAIEVELLLDGGPVASDRADVFRPDLRSANVGNGRHGFQIPLPPLPADAGELTVREASQRARLQGRLRVSEILRESGNFGHLDSVNGGVAVGWAIDPINPSRPAQVEFLVDGKVVGMTTADLPRPDVEAAGLGGPLTGFRQGLDIDLMSGGEVMVSARIKGSGYLLLGLRQASLTKTIRRWLGRADRVQGALLARVRRRTEVAAGGRTLSIVMPIYKVDPHWLVEALDSVVAQWCSRWELICVDDASRDPEIDAVLNRFAGRENRIKVIRQKQNGGIARATNAGLAAASGTHVAFMDHDDYLEPDAVHRLLQAAADGAELIYSDEALTTDQLSAIIDVRARPAFSYDYYLSHPYFVHMICVPLALARAIGGWDEGFSISADVDFVLRVLEKAALVTHVPRVLYRWRTHRQSTGHERKAEVTAATLMAINRHLAARKLPAHASEGLSFNQYRVDFPDPGGEVLIVVPTKNRVDLLRPCLESLDCTVQPGDARVVVVDHDSTDPETIGYMLDVEDSSHIVMPYSGPFNFPVINNLAVREHIGSARYILFLNNDIEAIEPGWLERMRSLCSRPDVGVVGATLIYGSGLVQHAGVIIGTNGTADHAHKLLPLRVGATGERTPGFNNGLVSTRDYSAVTAACMMMRTDVFFEVGGYDENLAVGFNDTDLCLRVFDAGYKVLCDPYAVLYHHESATRVKSDHLSHPKDNALFNMRWSKLMDGRDPYYSPLLTLSGPDHTLSEVDHCGETMFAFRTVRVSLQAPSPSAADVRDTGLATVRKEADILAGAGYA